MRNSKSSFATGKFLIQKRITFICDNFGINYVHAVFGFVKSKRFLINKKLLHDVRPTERTAVWDFKVLYWRDNHLHENRWTLTSLANFIQVDDWSLSAVKKSFQILIVVDLLIANVFAMHWYEFAVASLQRPIAKRFLTGTTFLK